MISGGEANMTGKPSIKPEREEVIEIIARIIRGTKTSICRDEANAILDIPQLAILSKDQSLPPTSFNPKQDKCQADCHNNEQRNMVKCGWRKVIKDDKSRKKAI
jgi:hypothetical protein